MTCNPKTKRYQILFSLSLSLALGALWSFYRLPTSMLPILIFVQWMPIILRSGPLSLLGRSWLIAAVGLLLFGVVAGVVRLFLGA